MRITHIHLTEDFKLIMEFNSEENRVLDMKEFLKDEKGLLSEIRDNLQLFLSVKIDNVSGTVYWKNGVIFDPEILYEESKKILK